MTLMEVMVVIAILVVLIGVAVPAISSLLDLQLRRQARDIVMTYQRLHDEAILQNVSFRIGYDLDNNTYTIEAGEPGALIFDNPDDREEWEDQLDDEGNVVGKQRIWTYIFPNGFTEHTVIWVVDADEPENGYTVEIEPLSGAIHLHGELVDWDDSYDFVPDEGPELAL